MVRQFGPIVHQAEVAAATALLEATGRVFVFASHNRVHHDRVHIHMDLVMSYVFQALKWKYQKYK